jgi:hypothetical protein
LPPNLDRLTESLDKGFKRFPSLANAGIRRVVNGPFTFTPDGNPLVGPVPGLRNYWAACGVMAGFAQGGGVGLPLAHWIARGAPEGDIYAMDVARFGSYASTNYTVAKAREFYAKRFQIAYPNEYWPAGKDLDAARCPQGGQRRIRRELWIGGSIVLRAAGRSRRGDAEPHAFQCLRVRRRGVPRRTRRRRHAGYFFVL